METIVKTIRIARDSERPSRPAPRMPQLPRLEEALEPHPIFFDPSSCVRDALQTLTNRQQSGGLVIDGRARPIGEFSQAAALRILASGAYHGRRLAGCNLIGELMRPHPIVVADSADPFAVAGQLLAQDREVAAVMRGDHVRGYVSRTSLLRLLAQVDDPQCTPKQRAACREERMP
ncbi:MAG: CBS domain-containing protein [Myxococcales bacterium]|nr:CBS domain-containing protein [Myxococcales bacterium]